ncbi:MAG: hypothetical protein UH685_06125 [Bacteroidaceae bacterium]|nr:hypothetical protein [Bacteroidaceae bacterium]
MEKIELTKGEIEIVELFLAEKIDIETVATDEQKELLMGVVDRAEALMEELNAYDELDDNLVRWYYDKYKQQG